MTVRSELIPIKTAAKPTKLCKAATSCGMPVISTLLATAAPIAVPIMRRMINSMPGLTSGPARVAIMAIPMPTMPYQTARLALSWLDKPPKARMNKTDAAI